jgi:hypothetical protein
VENVPALESYYSSHIAAVCESVNAGAKGTLSDMSKSEKRRETNRLSARRSRKRRRDEIERLKGELRRLGTEEEELTSEKRRLQQELQEERTKAINSPPSSLQASFFAGRVQQEAASQLQLHQHLRTWSSNANGRLDSSSLPYNLTQGALLSQASLAPYAYHGINSRAGGLSSNPVMLNDPFSTERNMLALLQNDAVMQVGRHATAVSPWPFGLQSQAANASSLATQPTRSQAEISLVQALSAIASLSTTANLLASPQPIVSEPSAIFGLVGAGGSATGEHTLSYHNSGKYSAAAKPSTEKTTGRSPTDSTSYEV